MLFDATVAQLVEQAIRNRQVRSSTLLGGSKYGGQSLPVFFFTRNVLMELNVSVQIGVIPVRYKRKITKSE